MIFRSGFLYKQGSNQKQVTAVFSCCIRTVLLNAASLSAIVVLAQPGKLHFTSREQSRIAVHAFYRYRFIAEDSDARQISYEIEQLPRWLHYDSLLHEIKGVAPAAGQFPVRILARAGNDSTRQWFQLTAFNSQTTNILCLGNSITNGVDSFNSYRRDLWQTLHARHYNFDFIGSWSAHHMGSPVPLPDFDLDHEGHSGWKFSDLLNPPDWDSARGKLSTWIAGYSPDLVLIELGTNDVFQCRKPADMLADLDKIVSILRKKNPRVKIFLAEVPPMGRQWSDKKLCGTDTSYEAAIQELNRQIVRYGPAHSLPRSPIVTVNQFTGVDPARDQFDDIHPNTRGEAIMARRWYDAIKPFLKKL